MMRKFIIIIIVVSSLVLLLKIRNDSVFYRGELYRRQQYLDHWRFAVQCYIEEEGKVPDDLYEVTWNNFSNFAFPYVNDWKNDNLSSDNIARFERDPEYFKQAVKYELIRYSKGWFVIELETTPEYPRQLMIDDKRCVYSYGSIPLGSRTKN